MSVAYALQGLKLVKAGFTTANPSEKQPEEFINSISLNQLRGKPIFFLSQIQCDNPECERQLKSGEIKLIHRWVRMYGTKLNTKQKKEFVPDEIKNNTVWSQQVIKFRGDWFVEVRTSDNEKLCLNKDDTSICEFEIQVTLK
jgi:hypothetical protein